MNIETNKERKCIQCDRALKGRSDKKYCDDYCRAEHNYYRKDSVNKFIRNTNNALIRNRRILESFFTGKPAVKKIDRDRLLNEGFQFKYLTHTQINRKKHICYFCYEFGYMPMPDDRFQIVKGKGNKN